MVIDANVLLAFYLPAEPYKAQALAVLGGPHCTLSEAGDAYGVLTAVRDLKLEERPVKGLEELIRGIAQMHQRTAYDAAYLALAEREGLLLITGDSGRIMW